MDSAIITKSLSTYSVPSYMIVDYFYAMGSDSRWIMVGAVT